MMPATMLFIRSARRVAGHIVEAIGTGITTEIGSTDRRIKTRVEVSAGAVAEIPGIVQGQAVIGVGSQGNDVDGRLLGAALPGKQPKAVKRRPQGMRL